MTAAGIVGRDAFAEAADRALCPVIRAIGASMGPEGRKTLYGSGTLVRPALTGVEIARRCCAEGRTGSAAAVLLRETLVKADSDLGDGTARLAVMAGAALRAGRQALAGGIEPGMLAARIAAMRPEIDAGFSGVVRHDVPVSEQLAAAGVSADLAQRLARAHEAAGAYGQVEVTTSRDGSADIEAHRGFVFDADAIEESPFEALEDVSLIVADDIITDFSVLAPVIEGFAQRKKSLVIAARGVQGQALALLERNRKAGVLTVTALKPVEAGPRAAAMLEDLAIATGASLVAERTGLTLAALRPSMLGHAASYRRKDARVVLTEPAGNPEEVDLRLGEISAEILASRHLSFDLEHARRRHARMKGRWVELRVSAGDDRTTEDTAELARRALASLSHARSGGVLPGAGAGLERIAGTLAERTPGDSAERAALAVIIAALRAPGRHLQCGAERLPCRASAGRLFDPASLSRTLLEQALSLATRILSVERAVIRF